MKIDIKIIFAVVAIFHTHINKEAGTTKITKTDNEILFYPIGAMIPELNWATIKINLNITTMFEETETLCKAYQNIKRHEKKIYHYNNLEKLEPQMIMTMMQDLRRYCIENTNTIDEIIDVFNLKQTIRPKNIPKPTYVERTKRQILAIGIAAVGVVTSIISIFTATELMNMSSSDDTDDLIDNNNHILTSIQNHETRINRQETQMKELKIHLNALEHALTKRRKVIETFLNLFGVTTYALSTT